MLCVSKKLLILLLLFPIHVFAQIEITEIMYDHKGTDTDYEWVEIYNTGSTVDISSWHFYEADTHHGLFPDGFTQLESGERAVIVQDLDIMRDELGDSINLIKSSFSLNNTGEELAMSDADKLIQTSAVYTSEDGALGNGMSLQKTGNNWIQASPTPGRINASSEETSEEVSGSSPSGNSQVEKDAQVIKQDYYKGIIETDNQAISRTPVSINAYVIHYKNNKETKKLKGGVYYINFGDGDFLESDERIEVEHIYEYPGTYEVVFEFYSNTISAVQGEKPKVRINKTVFVEKPQVEISDIDIRSSIVINNNGNSDIDLGEWSVYVPRDGVSYMFPKYSIIKSGQQLNIPRSIHGLDNIQSDTWIVLRNNNGISVSSYTENILKLQRARNEYVAKEVTETAFPSNDQIEENPIVDAFLEQHPNKEQVDFGSNNYISPKEQTGTNTQVPFTGVIIFGLLGLVFVVTRAVYKDIKSKKEEHVVLGDIELME